MTRAYLNGPHGQIHVHMAGEGGTPLLLLHQSPLSGDMFRAAMSGLAGAGYQAIAVDTPGYGQSDRPLEKPTIADYASSLLAVLDHFDFKSAHILGHHTGAVTAAYFAVQYAERVNKLVLNGVALLSEEERAHFANFRFAPLEIKPDGAHLLAAWNQRLAASPGWSNLEAMHRYCVQMLSNPDHYFWAFDAVFAHDMEADLKALAVPTLILTNTGEDLYAASQRAHQLRPDFAFTALEGGTHDIVDEQPDAWVAAVDAYLSS